MIIQDCFRNSGMSQACSVGGFRDFSVEAPPSESDPPVSD